MERTKSHVKKRTLLTAAAIIAAAIFLWDVIVMLLTQLVMASFLALAALPLCRALEKRIPKGGAAALSLVLLAVGAVLFLMMLLPPLISQLSQLTNSAPALLDALQGQWQRFNAWSTAQGMDLSPLRDNLVRQISEGAGSLLSRAVAGVTRFLSSLSRVLLSPLLAFYLLRDRRQFATAVYLMIPPARRSDALRIFRTVRRDLKGYVRGQLLLSMAVGGLTAIALLVVGTPAWLLLGLLMGVMELIPYVGPFLAGIPAVLMGLQKGLAGGLWALGAILVVQQVEASFLSPKLLGNAAKMHPMAVLLLVSAGGMAFGVPGMLLTVPAVMVVRGLRK